MGTRVYIRRLVLFLLGMTMFTFFTLNYFHQPILQDGVGEDISSPRGKHRWGLNTEEKSTAEGHSIEKSYGKSNKTLSAGSSKIDQNLVRFIHVDESIWPTSDNSDSDRILTQLRYVPKSYGVGGRPPLKIIYVPSGLGDVPKGRKIFIQDKCLVNACFLTADGRRERTADVRLFQGDAYFDEAPYKPPGQVWVMSLLESPMNTIEYRYLENLINWTATYRMDSTIVTPYEKFIPYSPAYAIAKHAIAKNYAKGKTKMVAWFVSNCIAGNMRWEFVQELKQFVDVDVYGVCGQLECPRASKECNKMLSRDYKFYLSFENSNCQHYITEKFFQNALWNDVVPIVMGARRSDYLNEAPPHSYIHVEDFESVRHLADYLLKLDANERLYNEYFAWKTTGEFVNTRFWCRLCALMHDDSGHVTWYDDVNEWWRGQGTCTRDRWDDPVPAVSDQIEEIRRI